MATQKPKLLVNEKRDIYKAIVRLQERAWKAGMTKTAEHLRKANGAAFDDLVGKDK